jgi:hypothetical protein
MTATSRLISVVLIGFFSFPSYADEAKCKELKWKLVKRDNDYGLYRGSVKAGTDVIHMELRNHKGKKEVLATGIGFPNPGGAWEISVYADKPISKFFKPKFFCESY